MRPLRSYYEELARPHILKILRERLKEGEPITKYELIRIRESIMDEIAGLK